MSTKLETLTRSAALTLALAVPAATGFAGSAFAYDAFGSNPATVEQAAQSARYANPADTPLARATAEAKAAASQVATTARNAPVASNDLVGQGGAQDNLARQIHTPGSGTDW